jgi:hypothetical protein
MSKIDSKSKNLLKAKSGKENLTFVCSKNLFENRFDFTTKIHFSLKINFNQPIYK